MRFQLKTTLIKKTIYIVCTLYILLKQVSLHLSLDFQLELRRKTARKKRTKQIRQEIKTVG